MKKILAIFLSAILLTWGISTDSEAFATTVKQEKQDIINDLEDLKNQTDRKKTKKAIDSAINQIEKSLEDKFWKDDSTLNLKPGGKVLNADQKAVNKLDSILKDKKEGDLVKKKITNINLRIVEIDKELVDNTIKSFDDIILSKKSLKKLDKAFKIFEKGEKFLEDGKYLKSIKTFDKVWDKIKEILKDPHFKKMKKIVLEGTGNLDRDGDGSADVYLKITKAKKSNKPYQVEMKMTGECVKGKSYEDAGLKIGFSSQENLSTVSFHDEFDITSKWFKKYDPDKKINPVVIESVATYFDFPTTGDNLIQITPESSSGSFEFVSTPIPELDGQTGWEGKFQFKGTPGDYNLVFWVPITDVETGYICNFLSAFSIPATLD